MCDFKDCTRPGTVAPKVIFKLKSGHQKWRVPAICGLKVCVPCRARITKPVDVLQDGGAAIARGLLQARPGTRLVSVEIGWTPVDGDEYRLFDHFKSDTSLN